MTHEKTREKTENVDVFSQHTSLHAHMRNMFNESVDHIKTHLTANDISNLYAFFSLNDPNHDIPSNISVLRRMMMSTRYLRIESLLCQIIDADDPLAYTDPDYIKSFRANVLTVQKSLHPAAYQEFHKYMTAANRWHVPKPVVGL